MVPKIDAVLAVKDHLAAFNVLLKGEFTEELERLANAKKELEAFLGLVDSKKKAESLVEQALVAFIVGCLVGWLAQSLYAAWLEDIVWKKDK